MGSTKETRLFKPSFRRDDLIALTGFSTGVELVQTNLSTWTLNNFLCLCSSNKAVWTMGSVCVCFKYKERFPPSPLSVKKESQYVISVPDAHPYIQSLHLFGNDKEPLLETLRDILGMVSRSSVKWVGIGSTRYEKPLPTILDHDLGTMVQSLAPFSNNEERIIIYPKSKLVGPLSSYWSERKLHRSRQRQTFISNKQEIDEQAKQLESSETLRLREALERYRIQKEAKGEVSTKRKQLESSGPLGRSEMGLQISSNVRKNAKGEVPNEQKELEGSEPRGDLQPACTMQRMFFVFLAFAFLLWLTCSNVHHRLLRSAVKTSLRGSSV